MKDIRLEDKEILEPFLKLYDGSDMYIYSVNMLYNDMSYKPTKYEILDIAGDKVLVFLRFINMFGAIFYELKLPPISISKNRDHEIRAIKLMQDKYNIKKIVVPESRKGDFNFVNMIPYDIDYYTNLNTRWVNHNETAFIKRHKIRQIGDKFNIRKLVPDDYDDVCDIYNKWLSDKNNIHSKYLFNDMFDNFNELCHLNSTDKSLFYGMFFEGHMIGYGLISYMYDKKYAHEIVQQTLNSSRFKEFDNINNDLYEKCIKNIGQVGYYHLLKLLRSEGVQCVSCAGAANKNRKLAEYKINLYKSTYQYFIAEGVNYED